MARVRLIEDDTAQLEVRKLILEHAGHTVVDAHSPTDVVVMDLHIPTLEAGLATIRDLAASGIPICVLSGFIQDLHGRPEERLVQKILSKPSRSELLLNWLATLA